MVWCVVKGDEVFFHLAKYGSDMTSKDAFFHVPSDYLMLHCNDGHLARPCDVFLARPKEVTFSDGHVSPEVKKEAIEYYGKGHRPKYADLVLPSGRWQRESDVDWIYYRRPGSEKGRYQHEYSVPVLLFRRGQVYRIALPDGCQVNWHGFVYP